MRPLILVAALVLFAAPAPAFRHVVYLSGSHNVVPGPALVSEVTHVALAFLGSALFAANEPPLEEWPLFTTVAAVREKFPPGTKILVAIGGWGDTRGFSAAAASEAGRRRFARNVARMVRDTGADGVDIDWEYPGGNGEDYKVVPNAAKEWEIDAYPLLLADIRASLASDKVISAAVPGLRRDMLAFTADTIPRILPSVDYLNVMTYDLMNRRDNVTKHHAGIELSLDAVNAYHEHGVPLEKMNLGFAFYTKWYRTDPASRSSCRAEPVGCKTTLMEDPVTGADLGMAGAFSWHDVELGTFPHEVHESFRRAMTCGRYDAKHGGHFYWDGEEDLWWSWETPEAIARKFEAIVETLGIGGVFPWALGEDAPSFQHLKTLNACVARHTTKSRTATSQYNEL